MKLSELEKRFPDLGPAKRKLKIIFLTLAILLILGFFSKDILIVSLLTIAASFSMIYNLFIRVSLGVELVLFATVLCSVAYGYKVGIPVGLVSLFSAEIISMKMSYNTFISFIGIAVVGFAASFGNMHITTWGILMTILYDLIIIPGYLMTGSNPAKSFIFVATHIPWNIWVFSAFAPRILEIMI